ncbi:hypothetical protein RDABS01_019216 [Bienertia sinuspersici]
MRYFILLANALIHIPLEGKNPFFIFYFFWNFFGKKKMKRSSESISSSKQEEKKIDERDNRRIQINELCSDLTSTIFPHDKGMVSQADKIERATNYIVELKERVDELSKKKEQLQIMVDQEGASNDSSMTTPRLPIIKVKEMGTSLEIQLVMGEGQNNIMLHQIITILEEEGAEVVNASYTTSGNHVTHTLHAKARSSRIGIEASRVCERLHELM